MRPFFLITVPRARGTLLMRMLDATPGVRCVGESSDVLARLRELRDLPAARAARHTDKRWPMFRQHADDAAWGGLVAAMLPAWCGAVAGRDRHYGARLTYLGREGWESAVGWWSWLLEMWPEAVMVFLTRDQGEVELSMLATQPLWRPDYGTCAGNCGGRLHHHLRSMEDFQKLNPARTVLLDSADLADYDRTAGALARVGIPLEREAWSAELAVVSGTRKEGYDPPPPAPVDEAGFDDETATVVPGVATVLVQDANGKWVRPEQPKVEVHTLRFGNPDWLPLCAPTLEKWCARHGYLLRVHAPREGLADEKFACLDMIREFLAGQAERMVFVDADVVVRPDAPEWPDLPGFAARPDPVEKTLQVWREWAEENFPEEDISGWSYCNSGVWSCDRQAAARFLAVADQDVAPLTGYREQHQWNLWWMRAVGEGMEFALLAKEWNLLCRVETSAGAWFHHCAGGRKLSYVRHAVLRGKSPGEVVQEAIRRPREVIPPLDPHDPFGDGEAALSAHRPAKPVPFEVESPWHERAIVYPWLPSAAAWGEEELRHSLRSSSSTDPLGPYTPALLTRMSKPPIASNACANNRSTWFSSDTSQT